MENDTFQYENDIQLLTDSSGSVPLSDIENKLVTESIKQITTQEKLRETYKGDEEKISILRAEVRDGQMKQEKLDEEHHLEVSKRSDVLQLSSQSEEMLQSAWRKKEGLKERKRKAKDVILLVDSYQLRAVKDNYDRERDSFKLMTNQALLRASALLAAKECFDRSNELLKTTKSHLSTFKYEMIRLTKALTTLIEENNQLEEEWSKEDNSIFEKLESVRAEHEKAQHELRELETQNIQTKVGANTLHHRRVAAEKLLQFEENKLAAIKIFAKHIEDTYETQKDLKKRLTEAIDCLLKMKLDLSADNDVRMKNALDDVKNKDAKLAETNLEDTLQAYEVEKDKLIKATRENLAVVEQSKTIRLKYAKIKDDQNVQNEIHSAKVEEHKKLIEEEALLNDELRVALNDEVENLRRLSDIEKNIVAAQNFADINSARHTEVQNKLKKLQEECRNAEDSEHRNLMDILKHEEDEVQAAQCPDDSKINAMKNSAEEWMKKAVGTVEEARQAKEQVLTRLNGETEQLRAEIDETLSVTVKETDLNELKLRIDQLGATIEKKMQERNVFLEGMKSIQDQILNVKNENLRTNFALKNEKYMNEGEKIISTAIEDDSQQDSLIMLGSSPNSFKEPLQHSSPQRTVLREITNNNVEKPLSANKSQPKFTGGKKNTPQPKKDEPPKYSSRGRRLYQPPAIAPLSIFSSDSEA